MFEKSMRSFPQKSSNMLRSYTTDIKHSEVDIKSMSSFLARCFISGNHRSFSLQLGRRPNDMGFIYLVAVVAGLLLCTVVKADLVQRIPVYQDVEAALQSTKCAVRDEIVDIRNIHPHLPSNVLLLPSCVLIRKCSGCCQNPRHVCKPIATYVTRVEVSQEHVARRRLDYITLNFTHHEECACMSAVDPTCIPRACEEHEIWNKERCVCEPRCEPQVCGHAQNWNPRTCRCECSPCHPDRLVRLRFDQDHVTCVCACRGEHRRRRNCEKRLRTNFSRNSCACVRHSSHGK